VAERESFDYNHIFAEWEYTHQQLKTIIHEMPPHRFFETIVYPWGGEGTISLLIKGMSEHELEHADEIEKLTASEPVAELPPSQAQAPEQPAAPQLLSPGKAAEPLLLQEKSVEQPPAQEAATDKPPSPGVPTDKQPQTGVSDLPAG
jgi:hypothetical protein